MAVIIIPARYQSSRFPGKPLADIKGKPMIQRVYERCKRVKDVTEVYVATDSSEIEEACAKFNAKVVMTSENCNTGTERVLEAVETLNLENEIVVNVQGDEPFIQPMQIEQLISLFEDKDTHIATLKKRIEDQEDFDSHNVVKVVTDHYGQALYFSRYPIPFSREHHLTESQLSGHLYYKHIGIYAFSPEVLPEIKKCRPSMLEKAESLEQLRWLESGLKITVGETSFNSFGIDTPEDINKVLKMLKI